MKGQEQCETLMGLTTKLHELSQKPWTYWNDKRKTLGLESMDYASMKFEASNGCPITKDTTVFIFRFDTYRGKGKGRIIGYKDSPCTALYVLGYDFDFSSYKH